jgi:hypothetical protein
MILTLILAIGLPLLVPSLVLIPPAWKLCSRAGFPRWFSFAMIIPLANLTLLYFIAFSQWPSELQAQRKEDAKNRMGSNQVPTEVGFTTNSERRDGA